MSTRVRLPNRRASETFSFRRLGIRFTATISRFDDGGLAEVFLTNGKVNSQADTVARDSAVVASLALQHGTPVDVIRKALLRDSQGEAVSLGNGKRGCAGVRLCGDQSIRGICTGE